MGASQRPADVLDSPETVVVQRTTSRERGDVLPAPLSRDHIDLGLGNISAVETYYAIPRLAVASTDLDYLRKGALAVELLETMWPPVPTGQLRRHFAGRVYFAGEAHRLYAEHRLFFGEFLASNPRPMETAYGGAALAGFFEEGDVCLRSHLHAWCALPSSQLLIHSPGIDPSPSDNDCAGRMQVYWAVAYWHMVYGRHVGEGTISFSAPMPLAFSDGTLRGHLERVGLGFSARAMAAFQAEPSSPQQELVQAIRAVEHGLDPCL